MAKSENQKLKLLYLAKFFKEETDEQHGLQISDIIAKLEELDIKAERKSLYSDIDALRTFGIDVQKVNSGGKVYYYSEDNDFEMSELKLLVDAVQGSKFITRKKSEALIKKITGLVSQYQSKELQRQVYVANRIKNMNESIYYTVDDIHRAINTNKKVSFKYYKWNANKEKELKRDGKIYVESPWALTWDDENYYLICYDSDDRIIKHFRVDKMMNIRVLNENREGAEHFKNFDMATYAKHTFGMFGGEEYSVTLLCDNDMADPIIDRFGVDTTIYRSDGEHFRAVIKVKLSPVFLTWVMNFGGKIRIEGPIPVRNAYEELIKRIADSI